jgi:hypothetical protein
MNAVFLGEFEVAEVSQRFLRYVRGG